MKNNLHCRKNTKFYKLSILFSMAFGDGYINKNGTLCVQHQLKQYDYLLWKASILEKIFNVKIKISTREDIKFPYCRFYFTNNITKRLRKMMYVNSKIINIGMLNLLRTQDALTIWYLDDGSLKFHKKNGNTVSRELVLCNENLSYDEHLIIQKWFKINYGIKSRINKDGKYFVTIMSAKNSNIFLNLLNKKIPHTMRYKVDKKNICL